MTVLFGPSVSFFCLFLLFLNQLTSFLLFVDYGLLPTMGADASKATTSSPFKWDVRLSK
jgi:hypothetical protein